LFVCLFFVWQNSEAVISDLEEKVAKMSNRRKKLEDEVSKDLGAVD